MSPQKKKKPKYFIVAIDGPAGAGKSTVSRLLAKSLKGRLLDTGATYRSAALMALESEVESEAELGKICRGLHFSWDKKGMDILVNEKSLGKRIRSEKVSEKASSISRLKVVRDILTKKQRQLGKEGSERFPVVVEGRDVGTVVFPDVDYKFFVTADEKVRAKRRYEQLKALGGEEELSLKKVLKQVLSRDSQDSGRKIAPLACPKDAIIVDTSEMDIEQVVRFMHAHIKNSEKAEF